MATGNTDNCIPSTKEYQVLKKYIGILTYAISEPVTLAANLYAADLISNSTRMKANTDSSICESRNLCILNDLMIAVAIDSTNKDYLSVTKPSSISKCYC